MRLKNQQIYNYASDLGALDLNSLKMPVRISFFLRKNIQIIAQAALELEQLRMQIAKEYGFPNEENNGYFIAPEKMAIVSSELDDLFKIEQDLNIHIFKLDDFDCIELTYEQLSAIMFMIEE